MRVAMNPYTGFSAKERLNVARNKPWLRGRRSIRLRRGSFRGQVVRDDNVTLPQFVTEPVAKLLVPIPGFFDDMGNQARIVDQICAENQIGPFGSHIVSPRKRVPAKWKGTPVLKTVILDRFCSISSRAASTADISLQP